MKYENPRTSYNQYGSDMWGLGDGSTPYNRRQQPTLEQLFQRAEKIYDSNEAIYLEHMSPNDPISQEPYSDQEQDRRKRLMLFDPGLTEELWDCGLLSATNVRFVVSSEQELEDASIKPQLPPSIRAVALVDLTDLVSINGQLDTIPHRTIEFLPDDRERSEHPRQHAFQAALAITCEQLEGQLLTLAERLGQDDKQEAPATMQTAAILAIQSLGAVRMLLAELDQLGYAMGEGAWKKYSEMKTRVNTSEIDKKIRSELAAIGIGLTTEDIKIINPRAIEQFNQKNSSAQ
jgi:hypothetical protein